MTEISDNFPTCPICETDSWVLVYSGSIRVGKGQDLLSEVRECSSCGVQRIPEKDCTQLHDYETTEYRSSLEQEHDIEKQFAEHDELVRFTQEAIWPHSLRNAKVADIGCGPGTFLDHISGISSEQYAIEPNELFGTSLQNRGYKWYQSSDVAAKVLEGQLDFVSSNQVIEHVDEPVQFVKDIFKMLRPGGLALITTPNKNDILLDLLPDSFPSFYYRVHHRWYFDSSNMEAIAIKAGFKIKEVKHIHRYGLSNTLHWLRDKKACGRKRLEPIDQTVDQLWAAWLNSIGRADNLFLLLEKEA